MKTRTEHLKTLTDAQIKDALEKNEENRQLVINQIIEETGGDLPQDQRRLRALLGQYASLLAVHRDLFMQE